MGMFDYVTVPQEFRACPKCGAALEEFQSKDGECLLSTLDYRLVGNFYTSCESCQAWVEYRRKIPPAMGPQDYELMEDRP